MGNHHTARPRCAASARSGRTQLRGAGAESFVGRRTYLRTELVLKALDMALGQRRPSGVIHHSDQGSQGRFKRSSQYLDRGNWDDYSKAPLGSIWASSVAVAGTASAGATGELSAVLGIGCSGSFE